MLRGEDCVYTLHSAEGKLDGSTPESILFLQDIRTLPQDRHVVLDLTNVHYMSSACIAALFECYDMLGSHRVSLVIVGNEALQSLFNMVGLTRLVHVVASVSEAEALLEVLDQPDICDQREDIDVEAVQQDIEEIISGRCVAGATGCPVGSELGRILAHHARHRPRIAKRKT